MSTPIAAPTCPLRPDTDLLIVACILLVLAICSQSIV